MEHLTEKKLLAYAVTIAVLGGVVGGSVGYRVAVRNNAPIQPLKDVSQDHRYVEESDFTSAIQAVSPAVVSIIESKNVQAYYAQPFPFFGGDPFFEQFFQQQAPQQRQQQKSTTKKQEVGGGSGFIVTSDGLVVTNRHVVDDAAADYTVILSDGREFKGVVIGKDSLNDLAIVQIKPKDDGKSPKISSLPVVEFGDSDSLKVGQRVLAIGNALGQYKNTVTAGIISATGRQITAGNGRGQSETLSGLLQTDAAINPGNSGGPLVNIKGQVIGVNVAMAAAANSIGFSIPFNDVKTVIESVQKTGKVVRPFVGVWYQIIDEDRASELQLQGVTGGALITGSDETGEFAVIPGGPGEKAGLKKGDVILEIDGAKVTESFTLQHAIRNKQPGDKLQLKVWSSGKTSDKTLTLGEAAAQ